MTKGIVTTGSSLQIDLDNSWKRLSISKENLWNYKGVQMLLINGRQESSCTVGNIVKVR